MSEKEGLEVDRSCPACSGTDFSRPIDDVEAVCDSCGLVINDWNNPELSEELKIPSEQSDESQSKSWSEVRPAHNSTQYRFSNAIDVIESVSTELFIPSSVRIKGAELYVEAAVNGISEGRSVSSVAAGSLHISAKSTGEPRPMKRIAETADIEESTLRKAVRSLHHELPESTHDRRAVAPPEEYLSFLCADLDLQSEVADDAQTMLEDRCGDLTMQGKNPSGVAAAVVYLVSDSPPPQRKLAAAAGVATETVRKRLNEFREIVEEGEYA